MKMLVHSSIRRFGGVSGGRFFCKCGSVLRWGAQQQQQQQHVAQSILAWSMGGQEVKCGGAVLVNDASVTLPMLKSLWSKAHPRVAADGGFSVLVGACGRDVTIPQFLRPAWVVGDMDSVACSIPGFEAHATSAITTTSAAVERYVAELTCGDTNVVHLPDQNSNDLQKALPYAVVVPGDPSLDLRALHIIGGLSLARLDHSFANLLIMSSTTVRCAALWHRNGCVLLLRTFGA